MSSRIDKPNNAVILMYHRVATIHADPFCLSVAPAHFEEHLEILRKRTHPMALRQMMTAIRDGNIPPRSVVLTFDDGYADNLAIAHPLMERQEIPATVFVTTDFLDHQRELWWDELERVFLEPGLLPDRLCLIIQGCSYRWELGACARYDDEDCRRHRRWRAAEDAPTARHAAYCSIWRLLQLLPEFERRTALDQIAAWADNRGPARPSYRGLSPQELASLEDKGFVAIGAHTVTHPALPELSPEDQRCEVQQSKQRLEDILGHRITSFAYPYGAWSKETAAIVREAGFDCACATIAGFVEQSVDHFQLPRIQVDDWDGEEFDERLAAWFDAASNASVWTVPQGGPALDEVLVHGKWLFRASGGNQARLIFPSEDPDCVRIDIARVTTQTRFDIQLNQPHLAVKANHRYAISFRARADSQRTLSVGFAQAHAPWDGLGLYATIDLAPEWRSFQFSFVAPDHETNGRIHFDAGSSDISVELSGLAFHLLAERDPSCLKA